MNFDFSSAVKAKESGSFLSAGIKDAKFKGVEYALVTSQGSGESYKTMALKLDIDGYGMYTQNIFEPQSNERKEGKFGVNASDLDHFLIMVREILEAVNPQILKDIDEGTKTLTGTFKQIVDSIKKYTDEYIDTPVQVKLIPNNRGYATIPSWVARIDKNGNLAISTRVIGSNLAFTASELKRIEAAKNAAPTNMKESTSVDLEEMAANLDTADDLPF